jgi:glycosyltransferase involved in cell wall biosynthesis
MMAAGADTSKGSQTPMSRVLLIHGARIPHYRVPIYSYLSAHLARQGFELTVVSEGIQRDNPHGVDFRFIAMPLSALSLGRLIYREKFDIIILFVDMRHLYLFPTYLLAKGILRRKMIWWGQGRDLMDQDALIKNLAYRSEQAMCDAIILYAEHLKKYVPPRFHKKIFVANNTLRWTYQGLSPDARRGVLDSYGITTTKNIICVGRLQRRKRLDHLVAAVQAMRRPDIGLILVGPDTDHILDAFRGHNIYKLGPLYGERVYDLLSACDVYCLPGAVGLSIVDAFHCGLPFVTEEGDESAEIMYLREGVNGFIVPRGDIDDLRRKLLMLVDNDDLRRRFSDAARQEVETAGHIDRLCRGFERALSYVRGTVSPGLSEQGTGNQ